MVERVILDICWTCVVLVFYMVAMRYVPLGWP